MTARFHRIGVLSDTHFAGSGIRWSFLRDLRDGLFAGVDMIFHAGDITDPDVLSGFHPIPVVGVRGNMDSPEVNLPQKRVLTLGSGKKVGLMHGWGPSAGLAGRILREFREERLDCLVFGHSHSPLCRRMDGILLFNPGSATMGRGSFGETVGLLEIGSEIHGKILKQDGIVIMETTHQEQEPGSISRHSKPTE